jgi:hypothetical protein
VLEDYTHLASDLSSVVLTDSVVDSLVVNCGNEVYTNGGEIKTAIDNAGRITIDSGTTYLDEIPLASRPSTGSGTMTDNRNGNTLDTFVRR